MVAIISLQPTEQIFGAEFSIIPSASLGARFSDNIHFTSDQKESDSSIVFSPGLEFRQRVERGEIKVKGKVYSYTYANNSEQDSVGKEISANGHYALSRIASINAAGQYKIDSELDSEITTSGLVYSRSRREDVKQSIGVDWALSEKTSLGTSMAFGQTTYEDDAYSDRTTQSYSINISSNFSRYLSETTGSFGLSHSRYDYDRSKSEYSTAIFGLSKNLSEKYAVFISAGPSYLRTKYKASSLEATGEWGAAVTCSFDAKQANGSWNLTLNHTVEPDSSTNKSVKRSSVSSSYWRKLSADLSIGISASYFNNESSGSDILFSSATYENTYNISPRFTYRISNDLRLEGNYRFSRIDDTQSDNSRTQNSLFFQLIWQHDISENDLSYLL